ncbi:MAG TPA: hypothetical protein VHA30_03850, partial [Patescibacteria group bacterium]|nr:hypothetical protein [Patescibacteria group bacterium]
MKALLTLKAAINQTSLIAFATLVSLLSVIYPEMALAASIQSSGQSALVFEIKDPNLIQVQYQNQLTYDEAAANDPLVIKVNDFLKKYNSPLAMYSAEIVQQPQWQRALAVSWVESNMGQHCVNNNCSGIGGAPGSPTWRKYPTKLDWFV